MPKRRSSVIDGPGGGEPSVAAVALAEPEEHNAAPPAAPPTVVMRPGFQERLASPLSPEEESRYNNLLFQRRRGLRASPQELGEYYEYRIRQDASTFNRIGSASFEERIDAHNRIQAHYGNLFSNSGSTAGEDREILEGFFQQVMAREESVAGEDVTFRPGYQDRLNRPLSRSEEVPRFNQLWTRWQSWEQGQPVPRLEPEELGELQEYLERRMVLPLQGVETGSLEERRRALDQLESRYEQLETFMRSTYPSSWEEVMSRHIGAMIRARNEIRRLENRDGLDELGTAARYLETSRREAMAAMSGTTDLDSFESKYRSFLEQWEQFVSNYRSFSERSGAGDSELQPAENSLLYDETRRAARLAEEWRPRFEAELERRRRISQTQ